MWCDGSHILLKPRHRARCDVTEWKLELLALVEEPDGEVCFGAVSCHFIQLHLDKGRIRSPLAVTRVERLEEWHYWCGKNGRINEYNDLFLNFQLNPRQKVKQDICERKTGRLFDIFHDIFPDILLTFLPLAESENTRNQPNNKSQW